MVAASADNQRKALQRPEPFPTPNAIIPPCSLRQGVGPRHARRSRLRVAPVPAPPPLPSAARGGVEMVSGRGTSARAVARVSIPSGGSNREHDKKNIRMDMISDPNIIYNFLLFAAPGLVSLYVRSQFITGRMPILSEGIIAYVTLSLIYQAAIFPIVSQLISNGQGTRSNFFSIYWILIIFIIPASIGAILGLNVKLGWTKKLLCNLKINTVHPVDTAWDWHFGTCTACWVMISLKDGTKWAGYAGGNSFMSSSPSERDIFIEKVYDVSDETDVWTPRVSSVWISHQEIQTIEFWPEQ